MNTAKKVFKSFGQDRKILTQLARLRAVLCSEFG